MTEGNRMRVVGLLCLAAVAAQAADIAKTNNTDSLDLGSSWVGGVAPGAGDVAVWDSTVAGANTSVAGTNLSWQGIRIADPGGPVTVVSNWIYVGSAGIAMSNATQDLTLQYGRASATQTWSVAGGRALNIQNFNRDAGTLTLAGGGSISNAGPSGSAGSIQLAGDNSGFSGSYVQGTNSYGTYFKSLSAGSANARWTFNGTYLAPSAGAGTYAFGALSGSATIYAEGGGLHTLEVGNLGVDSTYSGGVGGDPIALVKVGAGKLTLSGGNNKNYSGGTTVTGGRLSLATSGFNALNTTGSVAIAAGAVLSADQATNNAFNIGPLTLNGGTLTSANGPTGVANDGGFGNFLFRGVSVGGSAMSTISASTVAIVSGAFDVADSVAGSGTDLLVSSRIISGAVTKTGAGTMQLTGTNTFAGGLAVNAGAVVLAQGTGPWGSGVAAVYTNGTLSWLDGAYNSVPVTLNLLGGTFSVDGATQNAHNYINKTLSMQGGTLTSVNGVAGPANDGGWGNFILNGSTLVVGGTAQSTVGATTLQLSNGSSFNVGVTGSAVDLLVASQITGGSVVTKNGPGLMQLTGSNTYTGATTINNGTLRIAGGDDRLPVGTTLTIGSTNGVPTFDLNGFSQTVRALADGGFRNGSVTNSGAAAVFAVSNSAISRFSGTLGGALTLRKMGSGTLVLNGTNTHSATSVREGTLAGLGVAGVTTVAAGGAVEGGDGGAGSLTFASLTFDGAGELRGWIGSSAPIAVSGAVTANGGAGSIVVTPLSLPADGVYPFLSYGSGGSPIAALALAAPSRVLTLVDNAASQTVDFAVSSSVYPIWSGALNGEWSTNVLGDPKNWLANTGGGTDFMLFDPVRFDDSATGTVDVVLDHGGVTPGSTTFDNAARNYTLSGPGGVMSGALIKRGSGTLTIWSANRFSQVSLSGGVLIAGDSGALGGAAGGSLTFSGGTLLAGADLALPNSVVAVSNATVDTGASAVTLSGAVSGSGGLVVKGVGVLTLGNAANSYAGGTELSGGILACAGPGSVGSGAITLSGGTLKPWSLVTLTVPMVVSNVPGNAVDSGFGQIGFFGGFRGDGNVLQVGANRLWLNGNNSEYAGQWTQSAGQTKFTTNTAGSASARWVMNGSFIVFGLSGSGEVNFGALSGSAATWNDSVNTATLRVGALELSTTYSGLLQNGSGTMAVTKVGGGTWTLGGTNTYTGGTTVSNGVLLVNNAGGSGTGTGSVLVKSGATLGGTGTVGGAVTVESGGRLAPGASTGTLTLTNGLAMANGSILNLEIGGEGSDLLRISGGVFNGAGAGGVTLAISDAGGMHDGTYELVNWTGATASGVEIGDFALTLPPGYNGRAKLVIRGSALVLELYHGGILRVR